MQMKPIKGKAEHRDDGGRPSMGHGSSLPDFRFATGLYSHRSQCTTASSFKLLPLAVRQVLPEVSTVLKHYMQHFSEEASIHFPPTRSRLGSQETEA